MSTLANSLPTTSDQLKNETSNAIGSIQRAYEAAVENGLVGSGDDRKLQPCRNSINAAWASYRQKNYGDALDKAREADDLLSELIQDKNPWWRFLNMYAVPWFVLLLAWFVALVWVGYSVYVTPLHSNILTLGSVSLSLPKLLRLLIVTSVSGGLGAVLRLVYVVSYEVKIREFKRSESMDIFVAPFIGFLFGFLAYVVIAAGLLVVTQTTTPSSSVLYVAVAFLLGFNWKASHDYMAKVTGALLGSSASTQQQQQQPQSK